MSPRETGIEAISERRLFAIGFVHLLVANFFTLSEFAIRSAVTSDIPFGSSRVSLERQLSLLVSVR